MGREGVYEVGEEGLEVEGSVRGIGWALTKNPRAHGFIGQTPSP